MTTKIAIKMAKDYKKGYTIIILPKTLVILIGIIVVLRFLPALLRLPHKQAPRAFHTISSNNSPFADTHPRHICINDAPYSYKGIVLRAATDTPP